MKDRRAVLFLVGLVIVMVSGAVVIRSGGGNGSAQSDGNPGTTTSPSTTIKTITGADQADFDTSVRRATDIENALFSNPDPSRVIDIMTADCSCYSDTQQRLKNLASKGWFVKGPNIAVEATSAFSTGPDSIKGVVDISTREYPTVDKSGKVIEPAPASDHQPLVYVMKKGQDGMWRIYDRHLPEEVR